MEEVIKNDLVAFVDGKLDCAGVAAKVEQYSEAITSRAITIHCQRVQKTFTICCS